MLPAMQKLATPLVLALLATAPLNASDLALKDGRVFRDAIVVREDAATVTLRHAGGFAQVEKSKLPEHLLAQHPFDATQAQLETERQAAEVAARLAEAQRQRAARTALAARSTPPPEPAVEPAPAVDDTPAPWSTASHGYPVFFWPSDHRRDRHHERRRHDEDRRPPTPLPPFDPSVTMTPAIQMTPNRWPPAEQSAPPRPETQDEEHDSRHRRR